MCFPIGFYGLHCMQYVHGQLPFDRGNVGEVCHPAAGVLSAARNYQTCGDLECTVRWLRKYWTHR
jgi:hypothetical protein